MEYGATVVIRHGYFITRYTHLEQIPGNLKEGDRIKRGAVVGLNGCTGLTRYPHVHFSTHHYSGSSKINKGKFINPHTLWHVPEEDIAAKKVTVPFFKEGITYEHDGRLTMPIREEDCRKTWTKSHPTKPWRCR